MLFFIIIASFPAATKGGPFTVEIPQVPFPPSLGSSFFSETSKAFLLTTYAMHL
jgi:hypothetical protein